MCVRVCVCGHSSRSLGMEQHLLSNHNHMFVSVFLSVQEISAG